MKISLFIKVVLATALSGQFIMAYGQVRQKEIESSHHSRANVVSESLILQGGDTIGDAFPIPFVPFSDQGTTCGYNDDYGGLCPYSSSAPDVVYSHIPPIDQTLSVSLCRGSDYDTRLFICDQELQIIACNDDACSSPYYQYYVSRIDSVQFVAGNIYYIIVDGYGFGGGNCGNYTLDMFVSGCSVATMTPDQDPIEVSRGGQFGLTGYISNPTSDPITTDVRIMLNVPGYGSYGPLRTFLDIPLEPGETKSAHIIQHVPMYAPLGTYDYIAYCGDYPNSICDSAKFQFTVVPPLGSPQPMPGEGISGEWVLEGGWEAKETSAEIPADFILLDAYPNPFNAVTTINYQLPQTALVRIEIYNLAGQKVETLVDGPVSTGHHQVAWDASTYSSGIYFYKLTASEKVFTRRMTLLK